MKLFSGTSNLPLAQAVAQKLGLPLSSSEIIRFADSETRVKIDDHVKGEDVFVIQSTSTPVDQNLIELILLGDAIKRANPKRLVAVIPYFGYQRQDKIHRPGESLSAKVASKIIELVGFDEIILVDPHSELLMGFFGIAVTSLSAFSLFAPYVKKIGRKAVIVAPDAGGAKRAQQFAQKLGLPLALIEKWRDLSQIHVSEALRVIGDVSEKVAIIVDDVYVSGKTTVHAADLLIKHGASKVISFATQPVLVADASATLERSPIAQVFTTDVISVPVAKHFPKLKIISAAAILARAIKESE